jgi:peptidoglycan/LPS O-acetylase OafA/YrhL
MDDLFFLPNGVKSHRQKAVAWLHSGEEGDVGFMNFSDKLALSNGRPTGFDYLRLGLALAIVCMHSAITSYGLPADIAIWNSPLRGLVRMVLPMFFALSGFLVAGSLLRTTSLFQFLGLRAIRIYPALTVEVVLSGLLLGPLLTTVPLAHYFASSEFALYLLNVTGHIHYLLPGVFHANPYPDTINAQLWTVPFELLCYLTLALLVLFGVKKRSWIAPAATVSIMVIYLAARLIKYHGALPQITGALSGSGLIVSFLAGVSLYLYKGKIPWSPALCAASGIATVVLLGWVPCGDYVAAPVAAYFTVSLGLHNPAKLRILRGADYSYGIYLYGFVIQQTLMSTCPWAREWWVNILLSVPLAAATAALSWHWVEKPALELRRFLQPGAWRALAAMYWFRSRRTALSVEHQG